MENSKIDKQTDVHTENRNKGAQKEVSIFAFGCYLSITVRVFTGGGGGINCKCLHCNKPSVTSRLEDEGVAGGDVTGCCC